MDIADFPTITFDKIKDQIPRIHENIGPTLCIEIGVLLAITIVFVALRLLSRRQQGLKIAKDDYIIVTSLIMVIAMGALIIKSTYYGFGKHLIATGIRETEKGGQILYVVEVLFAPTNALIKISIIVLYKKIFASHCRPFNIAVWTLGSLWLILGTIATGLLMFQCIPISRAWHSDHSKGCIDLQMVMAVCTAFSVVFNVATLILPLPLIWNLKLNMKTKIGVLLLFIVGSGDIAISIARAYETRFINSGMADYPYEQCKSAFFAMLELTVAIMCACCPTLRPLWLAVAKRLPHSSTNKSSSGGRPSVPVRLVRTIGGGFNRKNTKVDLEMDDIETGLKGRGVYDETITGATMVNDDILISHFSVISLATVSDHDESKVYGAKHHIPYSIA